MPSTSSLPARLPIRQLLITGLLIVGLSACGDDSDGPSDGDAPAAVDMTDPQAVAEAYLQAAKDHDCDWRKYSSDDADEASAEQTECEANPEEYWAPFGCEMATMEVNNGSPDRETDYRFNLVVTGGGPSCDTEQGEVNLYLEQVGNDWRVRSIYLPSGNQDALEFID